MAFTLSKCFTVLGAAAVASALAPQISYADDHSAGVYLSPMVGRYYPAKNRGIDNSDTLSLGLGYDYQNAWGVELSVLSSDAITTLSDEDFDVEVLRLDALYHFSRGKFQPFTLFGVGELETETAAGLAGDDTVGHLGLGAKYFFSPGVALRADARLMRGFDSGENDYLAAVGVVFKFGASSQPVSTPEPVKVAAPLDSDNDGVADALDQCPGTAVGVAVDSKGCLLDGDGDGVADADDKCPDSEAGARVKLDGCYLVLAEDVSVELRVNFATNSDRVISDSYEEIERVAAFLKEYPLTKVVIEGHTDSSGSAEYNRSLSQRRAAAVAKILVDQFIVDSARVSAKGYGEDKPIVDNDTAENRAKNRRVTAVVSAQVERVIK